MVSNDGLNFTTPPDEISTTEGSNNITTKITFSPTKRNIKARFIKVIAENYGVIPTGNSGAGTNAWLFVDEIEVN